VAVRARLGHGNLGGVGPAERRGETFPKRQVEEAVRVLVHELPRGHAESRSCSGVLEAVVVGPRLVVDIASCEVSGSRDSVRDHGFQGEPEVRGGVDVRDRRRNDVRRRRALGWGGHGSSPAVGRTPDETTRVPGRDPKSRLAGGPRLLVWGEVQAAIGMVALRFRIDMTMHMIVAENVTVCS